jgi:hypothetical protein
LVIGNVYLIVLCESAGPIFCKSQKIIIIPFHPQNLSTHSMSMSLVVPVTLSCGPRVLPGHKVTWNTSTADLGAGIDNDFNVACTAGLSVSVWNKMYGKCRWWECRLVQRCRWGLVWVFGTGCTVTVGWWECRLVQRCWWCLVWFFGTDSTVTVGWWVCRILQ